MKGEIDGLMDVGMKSIAYKLCDIDSTNKITEVFETPMNPTPIINKTKSDINNNTLSIAFGFGTNKSFSLLSISKDIKILKNISFFLTSD